MKIGAVYSRICFVCLSFRKEVLSEPPSSEQDSMGPPTPPNTRVSNIIMDTLETLELNKREGRNRAILESKIGEIGRREKERYN